MTLGLKDTYDFCKRIDSISNKRSVSSEILKAYINIYLFLYERISDETVIPKLRDIDIIGKWVSNKNWLMIPPKDCYNKEEALISPYPNIWINLSENLDSMECGLHWAQANSVNNFLNLLDPLNHKSREKLKGIFSSLKRNYVIIVQKKIHEKGLAPVAPPDFKLYKKWESKKFSGETADEILKSVEEVREEGQQLRENGKVEWCVPTIQIEYKGIDGDNYKELLGIVIDYIKIVKICHETITLQQLNKIRRNLKKLFDYKKIKKQYEELKFFLRMGKITEEHFNKKINELNKMVKRYNLAFNKNLELIGK